MSQRYEFKEARRRYNRIAGPLMAAYAVLCLSGSALWAFFDVEFKLVSAILALTICLPIVAVLLAKLRYFEETDEYTRLRQLRAFARAGAVTVSAVFIVGFLQLFELVGQVPVFLFGPLFFLVYGLATCTDRWFGKAA
ncbi:MAG: hypothetical protein MRY64_02530 [Hyphomonadaceae bacterium]|nr:hypothetical protein [Hyphomonadaceae bacterium]